MKSPKRILIIIQRSNGDVFLSLSLINALIDFYNFSTKDKIGKILSAEKPDVCHTNNIAGFSVSLWDSIKKLGVPLVHTIRDYYSICATSKMLKNDQSCDKQCLECEMYTYNKKINSHKVDAVIGVSKFILDAHVENGYFNKAKMQTYIYNPIEKIKENFIKDKNQELVFGYFGLISSIKGVELLLSSFQKIKNKNIKLVLAGNENDPNYINGLKGKYSDDRIKFIGFVKPEEFFKEVDILIHPSLWNEPFGRVVAEGYAYGIPVIASLKGGLPEIVDDNKTGFLFKSDIELINHINYFIENRSVIEDMKENCIEKANSLLVSDIVDQYINVYRKIL